MENFTTLANNKSNERKCSKTNNNNLSSLNSNHFNNSSNSPYISAKSINSPNTYYSIHQINGNFQTTEFELVDLSNKNYLKKFFL